MAFREVIEGIHEIYKASTENEDGTIQPINSSCTKLQPRVLLTRLDTKAITGHTMRKLPENNAADFTSLFHKKDSPPFLGFGSEGSNRQRKNKSSANEDSFSTPKKRKYPLTKKKAKQSAVLQEKKIHTNVVVKGSSNILHTNSFKKSKVLSDEVSQETSDLPSLTHYEDYPIEVNTCGSDSLGLSSLPVNMSHELSKNPNSMASHLNGRNLQSGISANGSHANSKPSGLGKSCSLTDLTTLLLELNSNNSEIDKKITKIKALYERRISKLHEERKANEVTIQETLCKIQNWHDMPERKHVDVASGLGSPTKVPQKQPNHEPRVKRSTGRNGTNGSSVFQNDIVNSNPPDTESVFNLCHDPEPLVDINDILNEDLFSFEDTSSVEGIDSEIVCLGNIYDSEDFDFSKLTSLEDSFESEKSPIKVNRSNRFGSEKSPVKENKHAGYRGEKPSIKSSRSTSFGSDKSPVEAKKSEKQAAKSSRSRSLGSAKSLVKGNDSNAIKQSSVFTKPASSTKNPSSKKSVISSNETHTNNLEESCSSLKCGSYVIVKLSSKKSIKHFCAVIRNKVREGEYGVQYMERKNKTREFTFPEKETIYKMEDRDVVRILQEPSVKMIGLRLYYTFPDNLNNIASLN